MVLTYKQQYSPLTQHGEPRGLNSKQNGGQDRASFVELLVPAYHPEGVFGRLNRTRPYPWVTEMPKPICIQGKSANHVTVAIRTAIMELLHKTTLSVRIRMSPLQPAICSGVILFFDSRAFSVSHPSIMDTSKGFFCNESPPCSKSFSSLPSSRLVNADMISSIAALLFSASGLLYPVVSRALANTSHKPARLTHLSLSMTVQFDSCCLLSWKPVEPTVNVTLTK